MARFDNMYASANEDQKRVINEVRSALESEIVSAKVFYVDAPNGCGKTFVLQSLIEFAKGRGLESTCPAFTGITTSLMEGGRTLTGFSKGECVLIPRMKLSPSEGTFSFKMSHLQFPVQLAFVITINKSQGQSLKKVGVYLPAPVFTHGQLYVTFSRCRSFDGLKVFMVETSGNQLIGTGASQQ